jgi:lysozyme family protein
VANFDKIFKDIISIEGGYTNHPMDKGGPTKYGVTQEVARSHGYHGNMMEFPMEIAREIYRVDYFDRYNFDSIQNTKIAGELFEFTVNTGRGKTAVKFLQRAYNVLNKNIILTEDGLLGPQTARVINSYKFYKSLYKILNIFQGMYYISLAEHNSTVKSDLLDHNATHGSERNKTFIRGWIDKRVQI